MRTPRIMTKPATCALLAGALCCAAVAAQTLPAHAGELMTCAGTADVQWQPGITNQPQQVTATVHEAYTTCAGTPVTSGEGTFTVEQTASCIANELDVVNNITYKWSTGKKSSVSYTTTSVTELADGTVVVVSEGQVTSGFLAGDTAVRNAVEPQLNLAQCDEPGGVTTGSGPISLTITG